MKKLLSYILFCIPLLATAQQEDTVSLYKTISAERQILLNHFRAGRLDSLLFISDSIGKHCDIPLLWPAERLLLYYWTEKYDAIDSLAQHFDKVCTEAASRHPAEQALWNVFSLHSLENIDMLVSWIDQSGCGDDKFSFRVQLLETMIFGDWDDQASVNREIISFVGRHFPDEKEAETPQAIQASPPPKYEPPDDTWSLELGLGLGPTYVSGHFADYFSTRAGLSFNFAVNYKDWYFSLLMQPIFAKLKRNILAGNGEVWEAGKKAIITNCGLSLGYSGVNNKFLKITPFLGLSLSECSPTDQQIENNEALANAVIRWGFSTMYGIDTGFKLFNVIDVMKRKDIPVSLNVRLNYIPKTFNTVDSRYSGNMFLVIFGVGIKLVGE